MTFWDVIAYIGAVIGGLLVLMSFMPQNSAPDVAAFAAVGIGIAAVPYFIAATAHRSKIRQYYAKLERQQRDKPTA